MNPKRQHVGDAKESTSSQGHQGMFESGLALNLGPSPTVHRKDVRTGDFTVVPAPEDMAWMFLLSQQSRDLALDERQPSNKGFFVVKTSRSFLTAMLLNILQKTGSVAHFSITSSKASDISNSSSLDQQ